MLFNPSSNLTALTQNQATPSVVITIKRNPRVPRNPFRKDFFFLDLLDLLQQQQKDIPMTRLRRAKRIPKATVTIIGIFCSRIAR